MQIMFLMNGLSGRLRLFQVFVEKAEYFPDYFRVGIVHMSHAFLKDKPVFNARFPAGCVQSFHLCHPELFVQFPHRKESRRVIRGDVCTG